MDELLSHRARICRQAFAGAQGTAAQNGASPLQYDCQTRDGHHRHELPRGRKTARSQQAVGQDSVYGRAHPDGDNGGLPEPHRHPRADDAHLLVLDGRPADSPPVSRRGGELRRARGRLSAAVGRGGRRDMRRLPEVRQMLHHLQYALRRQHNDDVLPGKAFQTAFVLPQHSAQIHRRRGAGVRSGRDKGLHKVHRRADGRKVRLGRVFRRNEGLQQRNGV